VEEVMKCHVAFQPLLLSKILRDTLDTITENKKNRDEAQKARLNVALTILNGKTVDLPAYPAKTLVNLREQMEKQIKKIDKKAKK